MIKLLALKANDHAEQISIVHKLKSKFDQIMLSSNGNELMKCIISKFSIQPRLIIITYIYDNITKLLKNKHSIELLNTMIQSSDDLSLTLKLDFIKLLDKYIIKLINSKRSVILISIVHYWHSEFSLFIMNSITDKRIDCFKTKYSTHFLLVLLNKIENSKNHNMHKFDLISKLSHIQQSYISTNYYLVNDKESQVLMLKLLKYNKSNT